MSTAISVKASERRTSQRMTTAHALLSLSLSPSKIADLKSSTTSDTKRSEVKHMQIKPCQQARKDEAPTRREKHSRSQETQPPRASSVSSRRSVRAARNAAPRHTTPRFSYHHESLFCECTILSPSCTHRDLHQMSRIILLPAIS